VKARDNGFSTANHPGAAAQRRDVHEGRRPAPGTTVEVLAALKPAFREDGTVTAGNSCP
jgi:acetyl-CoA acetyltransferase